MEEKKLSKCPLCVLGEMKVYDITKYHSPDICDVYKLMCTNCDTTWDVAVKKDDAVENVWENIVERWTGEKKK